ncbi:hypothetical protein [Nonomuraea sp. 3N208]|uniref:hypothetical protein n=1 Tax=Nonomuraea sp. 3N208 TaxID=3457421 RepID=UPI003FCDCCC7
MSGSWGQRRFEDFLKEWAQDDADRHRRARRERSGGKAESNGGPKTALIVMVLIGCVLLVAASLGHSPAEIWDWAGTTAERLIDAWLDG